MPFLVYPRHSQTTSQKVPAQNHAVNSYNRNLTYPVFGLFQPLGHWAEDLEIWPSAYALFWPPPLTGPPDYPRQWPLSKNNRHVGHHFGYLRGPGIWILWVWVHTLSHESHPAKRMSPKRVGHIRRCPMISGPPNYRNSQINSAPSWMLTVAHRGLWGSIPPIMEPNSTPSPIPLPKVRPKEAPDNLQSNLLWASLLGRVPGVWA